jgi:subtilisin family serine protease
MMATTPVNDFIWDYNLIVRFKPDATAAQQSAALGSISATPVKQYDGALDGLMVVSLPDNKQNSTGLNQALATLDNNSSVKYVEKNRVIHKYQIPNDPRFSDQWGLHNTGLSGGIPDADIDAPEAWEAGTGSNSVIVAVIDTGVDYGHEDLRGNMWRNPHEIAGDGIDNDGNGYADDLAGIDAINIDSDPMDDDSHGTHVAGTVGAVGNNGIGVTGVAWDVRIMALKFLGPNGGSTAGAIECINYVTAMKLRGENIVASNNSWGGGGFSAALRDAIDAQGDVGVLFVAASGNGGADGLGDDIDFGPDYPTSFPSEHIIGVGATDDQDLISEFSNYGITSVDLAAPGVGILSTTPISVDPFLPYQFFDGTSMASPHVAGAIALLKSIDPTMTAAELKNVILAGVDRLPSLDGLVATGGRLNVNKSLALLPTGSVRGTIYTDVNGNGVIEPGFDSPLSGVTVYADVNKNGALDFGERSTVSDGSGNYALNRLGDPPGGFQLRVVEPPFFAITFPRPNPFYFIDFTSVNQVRAGLDFGLWGPPGQISGHKWFDANGNASLDPAHGDGPMQGVFIYVDLNNDGRASLGEPASVSDANGVYLIRNVPVGTWVLREVLQPGQSTSFPGTGSYLFNMTAQGNLTGFDFFNSPAHDYGDAPNSYRTLLASGGPVHGFVQGYGLGTRVDADANGQPTEFAAGDDNTFSDDEDGVTFQNTASPGKTFNFSVTVRVPSSTPAGRLNAWMDFNRDGDFADAGEKIISGRGLATGTYPFSVQVPAGAVVGRTYLRFRYGIESDIGFGGRAIKGEVEDYSVLVLGALPLARDDRATVQQFSTNNVIDVLANDVRSASGDIRIDPDSFPATSARGGRLTLVTNGTSDPSDDFVRYDAARAPAGTQPTYTDSFVYTITDGTNQDSATVRITINRVSTPPTAVDDTVTARSSGATTIFPAMYLGNDIPGTDRGMPYSEVALHSFTSAVKDDGGATIGTVSRNTNGTPNDSTDDRLIFTPAANAAGKTGEFSYTVRNPDPTNPPVGDTATITVQVKSDNTIDSNDIIKLSIEVRDTAANGGPAVTAPTALVQGQKYWVGIFSDDLRDFFRDDTGLQANGALSVYLDLLFDKRYVSPVRVAPTTRNPAGVNIRYGEKYTSGSTGFSGDAGTGGLINELGVTSSEEVVGAGNLPVLYVQFVANNVTPGTSGVVLWRTDPADERNALDPSFSHDVTVVNQADTTELQDLFTTNIAYWHSRSFRIIGAPVAAAAGSTTTSTTTRTPTAPQEPMLTTSTSSKTYSALDAAMAALFADEGSPYKKR